MTVIQKRYPFLLVLLIAVLTFLPVDAETPALRGLGEPAAPASMEHPERLGPAAPDESVAAPAPVVVPNNENPPPPLLLKPSVEKTALSKPVTLTGAVHYAETSYPAILRARAAQRAAKENITVQKLNEYLPDSLFQWQSIMASRNKITQVIYGSPVFPGNPGPESQHTNMSPLFFSGAGVNFDWAPIDFGLHKARIDLAREQFKQVTAQTGVTLLDTEVAAANAFLDVVEAVQQERALEENVNSFNQFYTVVKAQVSASLKAGADEALAEAQLANARNQLLRAQLNVDIANANLADALGLPGTGVEIDDANLVTTKEEATAQRSTPIFEAVPILQASKEAVLTAVAQRRVLNKEYWPVFHWLAGFQLRGSELNTKNPLGLQDRGAAGIFPYEPNYQLALIINWNFLDWFRLHAEKKVQNERIIEQQQQYNLVLNNLKTADVKARARVRTALAIASNMPVQVGAALLAAQQAEARYKVGLSSVAQVAEANQILAQSRMQEAIARAGVWRAMLEVSSVHGDIKPFLAEADRVQKRM